MTGWWAAAFVILWVLVFVLAVVVVALARQVGTLHLRLGRTCIDHVPERLDYPRVADFTVWERQEG
ncbi:MAG TPA: hypothetical protein VF984_04770 [Actinomycetota bacterium]